MLAPRRLAPLGREIALGRHCDGAAQAGVRTKAVAPSRGGARSDLDDRESTQCVCWPARTTRSASAVAGAGRRRHRTWVHAKPQLRADRERDGATDDAARLEIGESQVSDASATGTCIVNDAQLPRAVPATCDRGRLPALDDLDDRLPGRMRGVGAERGGRFGQRSHGPHIRGQSSVAQPLARATRSVRRS